MGGRPVYTPPERSDKRVEGENKRGGRWARGCFKRGSLRRRGKRVGGEPVRCHKEKRREERAAVKRRRRGRQHKVPFGSEPKSER